jgi:hypothetical protein
MDTLDKILWKKHVGKTGVASFSQRPIIGILSVTTVGILIVWYLLRSRLGNFRNGGLNFDIQEYFSSALKSPIVSIPEEYQRHPPGFQIPRW